LKTTTQQCCFANNFVIVTKKRIPSQFVIALHRRSIVTQISPTTSLLRSDDSDNEIYVIGTAHISDQSAKEVTDLIRLVKPDKVFIELCPPRAAKLRHQGEDKEDGFQLAIEKALQKFSSGGFPMMGGGLGVEMIRTAFKGFYGLLKRYGYVPGVEMLAAMKEADRVGAKLYFGDQNGDETLRKLKDAFQPSMLMKAMATPPPQELEQAMNEGSLGDKVEALKTRKNAKLMSEWMEDVFPSIANVLIHQRDTITAHNLITHCGKEKKVVAVVGLAHLDGIEKEWQRLKKKKKAITTS